MGKCVLVFVPVISAPLAFAKTPVKGVCELIAAAIAIALDAGSLLVAIVLESLSLALVDAGILTPLITKSFSPKGLKLAVAFAASSAVVTVVVVLLFELVKVNPVPALFAVKRISPGLRPAFAVTTCVESAFTKATKPSRTAWFVRLPVAAV